MTEVQYPIVIDQFYCPQGNCPTKVRRANHIIRYYVYYCSVDSFTETKTEMYLHLTVFVVWWCGNKRREIY
jgi:hypothetical protein